MSPIWSSAQTRELAGGGTFRWSLLLLLLVLPAICLRLASFSFNRFPHGDVTISALVADSIVERGEISIPIVQLRPRGVESFGGSTPLDYRPPLWPLMAAPLKPWIGDSFTALKLLSLVCGLALLAVAYRSFSDLFDRKVALLTVSCMAYSYLLIDFSANGSLYALLTLLFILFCHLLRDPTRPAVAVALGVVIGVAMLLHQSAAVLWLSLGAWYLLRFGKRLVTPGVAGPLLLTVVVGMVVQLPWLVRNYRLFGDAFYQTHYIYYFYKLGVPWEVAVDDEAGLLLRFRWDELDLTRALKTLLSWPLLNGFYLLRKLSVLAPLFALFAAVQWVLLGWRAWRGRSLRHFGVLSVVAFYAALCCIWPVIKFRAFTVLVPFVFALGASAILEIRGARLRAALAGLGLALVVLASVATFFAVPTHTYYYDGALTSDTFGRAGERLYQEEQAELRQVAHRLNAEPPEPVLSANSDLAFFCRFPMVVLAPGLDEETARKLLERYSVRYLLAPPAEAARYLETFPAETLHAGAHFTLVRFN